MTRQEQLSRHARLRGCILGGAIGDALGAPIEFFPLAEIRRRYGPEGLTAYGWAYGQEGAFTDDTQMTLFTLEGLLDAYAALTRHGSADVGEAIFQAYLRWHRTQISSGLTGTGLLANPAMHHRRGPGSTCLSALSTGSAGTIDDRKNNSKGCGGVMRVAPIGVMGEPFDVACAAAATTHGHPSGWLAAGALAVMISELISGVGRQDAVEAGLAPLGDHPEGREVAGAIRAAMTAIGSGPPTAERVEGLGAGWVAEEALAIAVYALLAVESFEDGIILAANHSGDSDSTASIAGQLWGAHGGDAAIPRHWIDGVEMADEIQLMANRLAHGYLGPEPQT